MILGDGAYAPSSNSAWRIGEGLIPIRRIFRVAKASNLPDNLRNCLGNVAAGRQVADRTGKLPVPPRQGPPRNPRNKTAPKGLTPFLA